MTSARLEDPFGLVGTTLDEHYRADEVVGEGGYGVVYRGWHESLEQPIAIKALKVAAAEERLVQAALFERFKDEAKLLYTLSQASLNVVRSMDFGAVTTPTGSWAPYMVLEWLEGMSLAEDLTRRRHAGQRGRSVAEAYQILEPAAEGLAVAHERRVAHRDIKPANIFLIGGPNSAPAGPRVKVLDFGIAKIIRDGDGPGTRSPFSSFTWLYAAPEQLDPRVGATGLATDVYAFALLLTELLTDRAPTDARDVVSLLRASTDRVHRPTPRQRGANVPDGVEAACLRALAVDPKERFADVREFCTALGVGRRVSTPALSFGVTPSSGTAALPPARGTLVQPPHSARDSWGSVPASPPRLPTPQPVMAPVFTGVVAHSTSLPPQARPSQFGPGGPMGPHRASATPPSFVGQRPYDPVAAALSPPPMTPPPGRAWFQRPGNPAGDASSSVPMILAVIAFVLAFLFIATCSMVHAAC